METLANWMVQCLTNPEDENMLADIRADVEAFCEQFPVPGI